MPYVRLGVMRREAFSRHAALGGLAAYDEYNIYRCRALVSATFASQAFAGHRFLLRVAHAWRRAKSLYIEIF